MNFPLVLHPGQKIKYEDYKKTEKIMQPPKLKKPQRKDEGVQLHENIAGIFEKSFIFMILGRPGSGKTSLLAQLISSPEFYGNKFGRILYITPSQIPGVQHSQINTHKSLDIDWINEQLKLYYNTCKNVLLVIDDVIADMPSSAKSAFKTLFYDRRHVLGPYSSLSIIVTSQKYTCIPKWLRVIADMFLTFNVQQSQLRTIHDQINTGKDIKTLGHIFKGLQKHDFVYFNLQQGKTYNHQFQLI